MCAHSGGFAPALTKLSMPPSVHSDVFIGMINTCGNRYGLGQVAFLLDKWHIHEVYYKGRLKIGPGPVDLLVLAQFY